ncbi:MAG: hypothetical protein KC643_04080 [Nitrospira sp.]|nr:hypothetical protein [Nitrospira sp.]MCA9464609.1 hypothetical protein [Nitrospira sp.]
MDYNSWIASLREVLQQSNNPLVLRNGHWEVADRKALWDTLGSRIFDVYLDRFKDLAVEVLTELDPQFELPSSERYAANIHGKVLKHSEDLRQGMTETLALLGNHGDKLNNCTLHKPENTATAVIHGIFEQANWQLWGSLNHLLPNMAEAAPGEFLISVEHTLRQSPCPFDELFAQEGDGFTGQNYMTGLLWALEVLAWDEDHLGQVALILAELASHDPGGTWANRPVNSLSTILLPWYPQTLASITKRIASIKAIKNDFPNIAWKVLLALLPNSHQTTSGAYKPRWHNILPQDWEPKVTNKDYWEQITGYAELAVEIVLQDLDKLKELVENLDNLPGPSFDALLIYLSSEEITELPENQRLPIWTSLTDFARKHRQFADAKWALAPEIVSRIEDTADKLKPASPEGLYQRLFASRDFDLYEETGNVEEQQEKLNEKRQQAIKEILLARGIQGVMNFIEKVESPNQVGLALGSIDEDGIDSYLLPEYLTPERDKYRHFVGGFIWSRYQKNGWPWVDELDRSAWSLGQNSQLLMYLPFGEEAWQRANEWLGESESTYWQNVPVNPWLPKSNPSLAIDKLLEAKRPMEALDCLHYRLRKETLLDNSRVARALLDAVSITKSSATMDSYTITELIKALQNDSHTNQDDLFKIEWAYLSLLISPGLDARPIFLETQLATEADFFCKLIRFIYRSKNEPINHKKLDEKEKTIANHAYRLLDEWKRPPGLQPDGSFSDQSFEAWIFSVKEQCKESGHFEVAMNKVGEVLFYCPPDPQGLWIVNAAANALNDRDADEMRRGFLTEAYNSRGVHTVDPTGANEHALAEQWRQKAETLEVTGFPRFAAVLRELAETYDREAESVAAIYKSEIN